MPRLRRSDCSGPGIRRVGRGKGFSYLGEDGAAPAAPEVVERIRALGIPPAWKDVWICPYENGHIQATGLDDAGRRQYLYHDDWRRRRDAEKFDEMLSFARALPALRERVETDLRGEELTRERVLACAVRLLDRGFFRIGTEEYTVANDSFGLATMRKAHVTLENGGTMVFDYPAKSGKRRVQAVVDPLVVDIVAQLKRRRGEATSCWRSRSAAAGRTSGPTRSTCTSRRSPAPTTRRRTSAPGARPCWRRSRWRSPARSRAAGAAASGRSRARSRRWRTTWATRPRCVAPPTSTRGSSTPTRAG